MENYYFTDIPKELYPFKSDTPFCNCIECTKNIIENESGYLIEKAIRRYKEFNTEDVIFEYALCMECAMELKSQISEQSQQVLAEYFSNNFDLTERMMLLEEKELYSINDMTNRCPFKNIDIKDCDEYQIVAECKGNQLVVGLFPYSISHLALDEMADLLSTETLGFMNGFGEKHFGVPPEYENSTNRFILI